jgi:hypothetical protein
MSRETERFGVPTSSRAERLEAFERQRAVDRLAALRVAPARRASA